MSSLKKTIFITIPLFLLMAGMVEAQAQTYHFSQWMSQGTRGVDVTELQNRLTRDGYYNGPVTGYFGPLTEDAVRRYQARNGIEALGIVGPKTVAKLNSSQGVVLGASVGPDVDSQIRELQTLVATIMQQVIDSTQVQANEALRAQYQAQLDQLINQMYQRQ